ncbi:Sugar kinase of the NBD/HSP70 family, may contain an N-terminal HTH domain [Geodermatophilus obscurus]|uniref:Sugar kinase of the NBD/HSP70 family, may contain an N-terminal HTH domain n=1 Tax=Geodermatophilus obscurus TaxID=1861 RepID=A0A1I5IL91_9ACTN|nr:ROK family protein [Geodermatophilus obscurus]SFO60931.1 Sugar kinase of the NBD/HSP70 family, may contain an N-terminal HTH domain [Geodermatophilus obscurus]
MTRPPSARDVLVLAQIVDLVRTGVAVTRPELESATGLGRTVVNERLREGIDLGVLAEVHPLGTGSRGRPSRAVRLRTEAGLVLSASLGAVSLHAAVSDLAGTELAHRFERIDVQDGPEAVLRRVEVQFAELLAAVPERPVWGIAIGLPGPVDVASGRVTAPPMMPGWDGMDVRGRFAARYAAPVFVDNEVNLMALGEWERGIPRDRRDLLFVKVATGVGSALVTGGRLHRGDSGAAGDIGHVRVTDDPTALCRCRKTGCLEAVAGGWALIRQLTAYARADRTPILAECLARTGRITGEDIGAATAAGDEVARAAVARAGRITGTAIAGIVNFANPGTLVLGGGVLRSGPLFFEAFERAVFEGTIELAARTLSIRTSSLDPREGTTGGALLVSDALFRPSALPLWLASGSPLGAAPQLQVAT